MGNQRDFICPIRAFKRALAGSLAGAKSEAFEYPGIVAEIVAQDGEVLAVGRGNAPSFAEETWLTQKSRGVTAEIHIEERAGQRQFTGNIPAFAVGSPVDVIETVPTLYVNVALRTVEQGDYPDLSPQTYSRR